jgi:hypothetical protein
MRPTASQLQIAAGIAALAYVARMLPVFVLPKEWGMWWFRLVFGDPSGGMGFAYVVQWLFMEVPLLVPVGLLLILSGIPRAKK